MKIMNTELCCEYSKSALDSTVPEFDAKLSNKRIDGCNNAILSLEILCILFILL